MPEALARAWDEGYTQGYENGALQVRAGSGANPYRPGGPAPVGYLEERIYLPDGMDPNDFEAVHFAVRVQWRAPGKWAVVQGLGYPGHRFLSSAGNWIFLPRPMHRRYVRHDFETACRLAEEHVNKLTVNGATWAQWEARRMTNPPGSEHGGDA